MWLLMSAIIVGLRATSCAWNVQHARQLVRQRRPPENRLSVIDRRFLPPFGFPARF